MATGASDAMRVLTLSWDFPPRAGGAAGHVDGLTRALGAIGHDVVTLTIGGPGLPSEQTIQTGSGQTGSSGAGSSVRVLRAAADLPWIPDEFHVATSASAGHHLVQLTTQLGKDWTPDAVHAHNWQVAWAAHTLAALYDAPLVTTFHATTRGQHGGSLPPGEPSTIHAVESWLAHNSLHVLASSRFMSREVISGFELPPERVHHVPNGIDPAWWASGDHPAGRAPLVLAWGRVRYEKGFQVLARAVAELRSRVPGIECIIAGRGSYLPELQAQVDIEGVSDIVRLVGFVPDERLRAGVHRAGCVVIPSLYEPFGVVALEALAGGAPLIAARTGGLAELLDGTGAGMLFEPGNAEELATCIELVLNDPDLAQEMRQRGAELLAARYSWEAIARATAGVYAGHTPAETDEALTPH